MMKKPKPLKVIVNRPSIEEAKRKIEEISKELSAIYSQELRRED